MARPNSKVMRLEAETASVRAGGARFPFALKLIWVMLPAAGAGFLALAVFGIAYDTADARREFAAALAGQAHLVAWASAPALAAGQPAQARPALEAFSSRADLRAAALYDRNGVRLLRHGPPGAPPQWALPQTLKHTAEQTFQRGGYTVAMAPVRSGTQTLGHLVVVAAQPAYWPALRIRLALAGGASAIALIAALLVALPLARLLTRPAQRLAQTAHRIAHEHDWSVRTGVRTRDEIGVLARALDGALDVLEEHDRALARARSGLEDRIHERTRALEQEIAERQRAEQERAAALQQREQIMENLQDVVYALDTHGCLTSFNRRLNAVTELGSDELHGRPLVELFVEEDRPTIALAIRRALREGHGTGEGRLQHANGETAYFELSGRALLDAQDRPVGITGVARDVTARREAEAEVRRLNAELEARVQQRTAQLEATNRELETFSYSVSHDLRAPLRSIDGFSRALAEDLGSRLDAQTRDSLERIRAAAARMGALIDDLLELSRVSRGELRLQPVDLGALALRVGERLAQAHPQHRVAFTVAPDLNAVADARLMEIVFENLLGNAWKFTAHRAQPQVTVSRTMHNGREAYCVRDNGAGFDMAYAGRLFSPFQRLHADSEFPGTGIGLATVQRIVLRHGGAIWAEAAPDAFASFYFTLPYVKNET